MHTLRKMNNNIEKSVSVLYLHNRVTSVINKLQCNNLHCLLTYFGVTQMSDHLTPHLDFINTINYNYMI